MKKLLKSGFTLVELLIVIALLGALAVGLLAALDPFEQLKKGTDTGTRNTVSEIHGSVIRYYAIKDEMPWEEVGTYSGTAEDAVDYISMIVETGELKSDFSSLAGGKLENINIIGNEESVTVCFQPGSKSFRSDKNTKFDSSGVEVTDGSCPSGSSTSCYWCVK